MVRSNEMGVMSSWWSMESDATMSHGQEQGGTYSAPMLFPVLGCL